MRMFPRTLSRIRGRVHLLKTSGVDLHLTREGSNPMFARGNGFVLSVRLDGVIPSLRRGLGTVAKIVRDKLFVNCSVAILVTGH